MDTQRLSTYQAKDRRLVLAPIDEISSNLLPEQTAQVGRAAPSRSFLENVQKHQAVHRAGAPVEGAG